MTDGLWGGMRMDAPPPGPEPAADPTPEPDPEDAAVREVLREVADAPAPEPVPEPEPDRFCPLSFSGEYHRHCTRMECALWGRYAVGRHDVREPTMFKYIQFVTREGCTLGRQVME